MGSADDGRGLLERLERQAPSWCSVLEAALILGTNPQWLLHRLLPTLDCPDGLTTVLRPAQLVAALRGSPARVGLAG